MAGGFGTRLRPLTCNIPKPMTPLLNRPIIEHNISLLKHHGIKDLIILLYYQSEAIRDYFKDGRKLGVKIEYLRPDADYGTAGAVYQAYKIISDSFIVISGDVVTDFNLTKAVASHIKKGAEVTILLTHSSNPLQFGIILTEKNGKITKFFEKPTWSEVFSDTINTGIYILDKETLALVPKATPSGKQDTDFSKDLFPYLLRNKSGLYGYVCEGYWKDVGSLEDYITTNMDALKGKIKLTVTAGMFKKGNVVGKDTRISRSAKLTNCVIGNNCTILPGAVLKNTVLWDNVEIGSSSKLNSSVLCNNVNLKSNVKVSENVFIGDDVRVGNGAAILQDVKIWPGKAVDANSVVMKSLIWEDRWKDSLFSDSRITGLANIEITSEFGARLGEVFGVFIGKGLRINISRDTDHISRMIKGAVISGLMSSGVDVIDLQTTPVPILRQELRSGKASGGVFVRKSPFDASKIDIIFFDSSGKDLSTAKTKTIERLYFSGDHQPIPYFEIGSVAYSERTNERYKEHFMSHINPEPINKRRFRIVINYSHGITSSVFPIILGEFNIELVSLDTHLDSSKQTRSLEEFTGALKKLSYVVTSLKYDAGFLIDAGGEKIFLVDDAGRIISHDRFLTLVTKLFLSLYPGTEKIAVPIQASGEIDIIAKISGTEVLRVKDSHFAMMNAASEPGVRMVGGTKGGVIFPEFLFATDGMYAIVKILEMLAVSGKSLSALEKECPGLYMAKHNLFCSKEFKGRIMRKLVEESEGKDRQLIDGIKIHFGRHRWVLCIPDSERDIFHVNAEAKSQKEAVGLVKLYTEKIIRWQKELTG